MKVVRKAVTEAMRTTPMAGRLADASHLLDIDPFTNPAGVGHRHSAFKAARGVWQPPMGVWHQSPMCCWGPPFGSPPQPSLFGTGCRPAQISSMALGLQPRCGSAWRRSQSLHSPKAAVVEQTRTARPKRKALHRKCSEKPLRSVINLAATGPSLMKLRASTAGISFGYAAAPWAMTAGSRDPTGNVLTAGSGRDYIRIADGVIGIRC
jgi:hypothetical protein